MSIIISLLTVIMVFVSLLIVLLVLMQRPKQEGLGAAFGGGMTDQMFGAQTSNVLQRGTVWLAIAFFVISLLLSVLISQRNKKDKELGSGLSEGGGSAASVGLEESALAPISGTSGVLGGVDAEAAAALGLEQPSALGGGEAPAPAAETAGVPELPQVPASAPESLPAQKAKASAPEGQPSSEATPVAAPSPAAATPAAVVPLAPEASPSVPKRVSESQPAQKKAAAPVSASPCSRGIRSVSFFHAGLVLRIEGCRDSSNHVLLFPFSV